MASNQHFCLRWNNHQSTLISVFDHLLESGTLVDCTLAAEGQFLKAHKVVLSACSPYLEALLSQHYEKHPILILKDVTFHELKSMLDYMYRGEVNISQEQLGTFLKAAESLQIKGLTDSSAISESRDFERSRELERARDINRVDRPIGVPKRMDIRKHISRSHSPLIGLPPNLMMNVDQRGSKHSLLQEIISASPTVTRNREGSTSPSNKRKRQFPPYLPSNDDPSSLSNALENNHHEENHKTESKNKDPSSVFQNVNSVSSDSPAVPPLHNSKRVKKKNDNDNLVESVTVKQEVKTEHVDFSDEVNNDDSVEDLTVDEEEEEMDEGDISKPGPSSASNSHVAGVPWHIAGEGNGEEMLLAGQQESQGARKYLMPLQMHSWEAWSALHPSVPNLLRGALSYTSGFEEQKGVECSKCGRHYKLKSSLRNHQKWECGKEPQFQCPYCNYRAKQKMHVARHIERMHREKLYMLESDHERSIKEEPSPVNYQQEATLLDSSLS